MNRVVVGLDVGGTKIAAGLVSAAGEVTAATEVPTPATADPEEVFTVAAAAVREVIAAGGGAAVAGVGAGCGGPMTRTGVSPLNIPAWRDFPLGPRLEAAFGVPAVVDNDAKAMALGEGWLGAARGRRCFLGMVVSTGVGGGIVLDGRLLHGRETNAGHIGHVVVNPGGEPCACGGRGCLEAEASGTAIAHKAARRVTNGEARGSLLEDLWARRRADTGSRAVASSAGGLTAADVAAAAGQGDSLAARLMEEAGGYVGLAIADVANLLDLDLAVVGGGVAAAGDLLFGPCREAAARNARLEHALGLEVVPAALGRRAGVVGAAALWFSPPA